MSRASLPPSARHLLVAAGLTASVLGTGAMLSFYEETLPGTLNPLYASSMVDWRAQELLFDRLYYHRPIDNQLTSRIVEKGEVAETGKAWKVTLKNGLKWHNGQKVTAKDVCFTVNAMLDPATPSLIAADYRTILAGCETQGELVAVVKFTKVFHNPRDRLGFAILPSSAFEGNTAILPDNPFSSRPIGSGPYKGSRGRRSVTVEAFPNGHHNATISQLQLQEGGDPAVQVSTLKNNGMQGMIAVPPPFRPEVTATDDLQLKGYDLRSWWFVAVNTNKGPLADKRVRQALNLLLDRSDLREKSIGVKPGEQNSPCEFISGPFVQSSPFYNRSIPFKDRADRTRASALLNEAGLTQVGGRWHYKGAPITLKVGMLYPLNNEAPDLLTQISNQLQAGGFDRTEEKISADDWQRKVVAGKALDYDLVVGKWSFGVVEDVNDIFETRAGPTKGSRNIFNYSSAAVDKAIVDYKSARTDTTANDAYHRLHQILADESPYLFLWKLDTKSAWRSEVRGNTIAPYHYWTEVDAWKY